MSRGLGRIERTILDALHATTRPYVALWELICLLDGQVTTLDEPAHHWRIPICTPHPKRHHPLGMLVDHDWSCRPPRPEPSVQESVSRAVRALVRKGFVRCEYEGYRPKRLLVYLPSTDPGLLPKAQRRETLLKAQLVFGLPLPYERWRM
jgi:hypothetical protein